MELPLYMQSSAFKVSLLWTLLIAASFGTYFLSNKIQSDSNAAAAFMSLSGGSKHVFTVTSDKISPLSVTVHPGDEVSFVIQDDSRHDISEDRNQRKDARLESGEIGKDDSYSLVFQNVGTFYFYDRLNQDIHATIIVR